MPILMSFLGIPESATSIGPVVPRTMVVSFEIHASNDAVCL